MAQYLYRIHPSHVEMLVDGRSNEEQEIISSHFSYLQGLMSRGTLILAGRTLNRDDSTFGVVIFNADSEDAARAIMEGDPAVRAGVMQATLFPYRVTLISEKNASERSGSEHRPPTP